MLASRSACRSGRSTLSRSRAPRSWRRLPSSGGAADSSSAAAVRIRRRLCGRSGIGSPLLDVLATVALCLRIDTRVLKAAARHLAALAPGRVAVAFGTGFAGARAMGARPSTWPYLRDYVQTFRGLLRGRTVDWNGGRMCMLHPPGAAPSRPIDIPVLIAALGPKGLAVAKELAAGLFSVNGETEPAKDFTWAALGVHGTVLDEGEALDSPRVRAAAGPGNALAYHAAYEFGGDVTRLPAGQVWLDIVNQAPERERHLAVFDQHLVALSQADEAAWAAGSWAAVPTTTLTGSAAQLTERLAMIAEQGITEVVYQPTGPDIPRELEAFITAACAVPVG
ncbi:MAG: LLM class flavin-dependent oxidoreductase [Actinobacteria bacterium]|nr:MAG: LLM class flavin-dependent oxidoreductase [Actinomycetota bacterium]